MNGRGASQCEASREDDALRESGPDHEAGAPTENRPKECDVTTSASAVADGGEGRGPPPPTDDAAAPNGAGQKRKRTADKGNGSDEGVGPDETTTVDDLSAMDVTTYLAWVNRQAKALPDVFVAGDRRDDNVRVDASKKGNDQEEDKPIEGSRATLDVLLSKRMDILPPPSARHLPATQDGTTEAASSDDVAAWVSATISNFSALRSYLEAAHAKLPRNPERKVAVPRMKDRAAWHVFCLGKEEAYGNAGGYYEGLSEEEEEGASKPHSNGAQANSTDLSTAEEGKSKLESTATPAKPTYDPSNVPTNGHPPTTSLLLQLDQVLTRTLFHHHVHYLTEWKFPLTPSRAQWMYALLARMEKPWHREECAAVRCVLRECCARRWELKFVGKEGAETSKVREQLAHLNTLIAITGIYYEQGSFAGGDGMDALFRVAKTET